MTLTFWDNSDEVKAIIEAIGIAWLHEASGEMESQVKRNTRVDTSRTKESWDYKVDEGRQVATIGSPKQTAIWEEFGTGIHASKGDGRKTPWAYQDPETGEWIWTKGKTATHAFQKAYKLVKPKAIKELERRLKGLN